MKQNSFRNLDVTFLKIKWLLFEIIIKNNVIIIKNIVFIIENIVIIIKKIVIIIIKNIIIVRKNSDNISYNLQNVIRSWWHGNHNSILSPCNVIKMWLFIRTTSKPLIRQTGCQDTIDECSRLEPKDCYSKYYATTCCRTCRVLIENPWDANCLYGDKGVLCSYLVPEVCHITTRYCCQTCADHPTPSKTTGDTSASPSQIITPNNASLTSLSKIICFDSQLNQSDETVLLIVLKLCYLALKSWWEVGARRGSCPSKLYCRKTVVKFLNCLKLMLYSVVY